MKFLIKAAALPVILASTLILAGCGSSLKGSWQGAELTPEMARDQFKFLVPADTKGKLIRADVQLQKDKTFSASVIYDNTVIPVTGTWSWKNEMLTMRDSKGESYIYAARKDGDKLEIIKGIKGTDATLHLEKE